MGMRLFLRQKWGKNMAKYAVLDIGSNSVRLLLHLDGQERLELETTRLGQGVADRMLQPQPVARTIAAIERFCGEARAAGVEEIHAFATSAVRDARNREALLEPIKRLCGVEIDVIPGQIEAELAYMGAAEGRRACVIDIGGASTELVAGDGNVRRAVSLQVGAVRLKERCGKDRTAAEAFLTELFSAQKSGFSAWEDAPFLGIGGTLTTLAAMQQGLKIYDEKRVHGYVLTHETVLNWVDKLWDLPVEQRVFPGLKPTRADIIAHGALIAEQFMAAFHRAQIVVSTGDNLHGYLAWKGVI